MMSFQKFEIWKSTGIIMKGIGDAGKMMINIHQNANACIKFPGIFWKETHLLRTNPSFLSQGLQSPGFPLWDHKSAQEQGANIEVFGVHKMRLRDIIINTGPVAAPQANFFPFLLRAKKFTHRLPTELSNLVAHIVLTVSEFWRLKTKTIMNNNDAAQWCQNRNWNLQDCPGRNKKKKDSQRHSEEQSEAKKSVKTETKEH